MIFITIAHYESIKVAPQMFFYYVAFQGVNMTECLEAA